MTASGRDGRSTCRGCRFWYPRIGERAAADLAQCINEAQPKEETAPDFRCELHRAREAVPVVAPGPGAAGDVRALRAEADACRGIEPSTGKQVLPADLALLWEGLAWQARRIDELETALRGRESGNGR